ncbi:hypothetical protein N0V82_002518 [Gnomoniopsis sp. IMI 355080]|nr:hypothetical protein N0V82_002518 [Gnomoniopsis sp. IMI 355080]
MAWFWGATAPAESSQNAEHAQAQPPAQPPPKAAAPAAPAASEPDPEMRKFLEELMGEVKNMREADQAATAATPPPSNKIKVSPWGSRWASSSSSEQQTPSYTDNTTTTTTYDPDNPNNEPRLSPLAESLLPTTMNCESAFNLAFHCRSLGGQFTSLYRYGTMRSCDEQWKDFTFCMRVKGFGEGKVKEDAIRDYYRKKELAKYGPGMPSSDDVWKERKELVKPGEAFSTPVEQPTVGDAEHQKWEMERMERIRKGLKESETS